jgi:hypothetical protein
MRTKGKSKAYYMGESIVLPNVRYLNSEGRKSYMMFHSFVVRINGKYKTLGCDKMDESGFCLGHSMSREDFIKKYCFENRN